MNILWSYKKKPLFNSFIHFRKGIINVVFFINFKLHCFFFTKLKEEFSLFYSIELSLKILNIFQLSWECTVNEKNFFFIFVKYNFFFSIIWVSDVTTFAHKNFALSKHTFFLSESKFTISIWKITLIWWQQNLRISFLEHTSRNSEPAIGREQPWNICRANLQLLWRIFKL